MWVVREDSGVQFFTARILSPSVDITSSIARCPKYFKCFLNNAHFLTLNFILAVGNRCRTLPRFLRCLPKVLHIAIMSSRYTIQVFKRSSLSIRCISRSNVAEALESPNGILQTTIIRMLFPPCPCLQSIPAL